MPKAVKSFICGLAIIGAVLLIGVVADELTKRVAARRKIVT